MVATALVCLRPEQDIHKCRNVFDHLEPRAGDDPMSNTLGLDALSIGSRVSNCPVTEWRQRFARLSAEPKERSKRQGFWVVDAPNHTPGTLTSKCHADPNPSSLAARGHRFELYVPQDVSGLDHQIIAMSINLASEDLKVTDTPTPKFSRNGG
jgi:hypothetical protein